MPTGATDRSKTPFFAFMFNLFVPNAKITGKLKWRDERSAALICPC